MLQLTALRLFMLNPRAGGALLDLPPPSQITFCLLGRQQGVLLPSVRFVFFCFFFKHGRLSELLSFFRCDNISDSLQQQQQRHLTVSKQGAKVKL